MGLFDIFKKKDRVIEDFNNALENKIITEEEYKILVEKYRLGIIGYYKEQLTSGSITKVEYDDKCKEFKDRPKQHQQANNAAFAVTCLPGIDNSRASILALSFAIKLYYTTPELTEKNYKKIADEVSKGDDEDLTLVLRILSIFGDVKDKILNTDVLLRSRQRKCELKDKLLNADILRSKKKKYELKDAKAELEESRRFLEAINKAREESNEELEEIKKLSRNNYNDIKNRLRRFN